MHLRSDMKREKKRALYLWNGYQRRRMISYVAQEKAFKKRVIDIIFNDNIGLFVLFEHGVRIKVDLKKFQLLQSSIREIVFPQTPPGINAPSYLAVIDAIVLECHHAV